MTGDSKKSETAKREEETLKFWQENKIFEKSLAKPASNGEFVFYDGPPFATGLPHYGSLLSSVVKDVIPRYKTMRGHYVRRRWGWDCHGLPIENMIEKRLGLKDKTEIEKIGIEKFNETCRSSVLEYATEWKQFVDRIARWVEYDNAYMTMDATYTESVWWALKQIFEKGLLYEGRKVLLYCPHCQTPLAKAEIQMDNSYKDVTEEAVTVKFHLKPGQSYGEGKETKDTAYILAWTTTPWTLPGNVALAVGKDISYTALRVKGVPEMLIVASDRVEDLFAGEEIEIVHDDISGEDLTGLEYEPLYEIESVKETGKKTWYVSDADFVTTEEGTGIVHTAVIYGEDDYELGLRLDLPMVPLLDEKGHFIEKAPDFIRGMYFKKSEKAIKEDLESRGLLFKKEQYTHSYPHCHRCGTALLYNALTSWFLDIQKIKKRMMELNEKINWIPEHLKHGRFLNILENAPDWTISRNRYWASPLPIWKSASGKTEAIGSLEELKEKTKTSNKYFVMRHGEAEGNLSGLISTDVNQKNSLTEKGIEESKKAAEQLKDVSIVYTSPYTRTKETAKVVAETLGLSEDRIIEDERLSEIRMGEYEGRSWDEYHKTFSAAEQFENAPPGGETRMEVKRRVGEFIYDIAGKHQDEQILIVTHGAVIGALNSVVEGADLKRSIEIEEDWARSFSTGEVHDLDFVPLPHNRDFELDFHRPYIDDISWTDEDGELMERIPEVVDGWVESASMPFAEYHYPFENKEDFERRFPGDFVAEYIAQTRTWFYYMLVVSTFLFDDVAFKNVVTTGNILAEDGSKMSKSKGNYTDPMINLDRFGADALRYYLMTSVVMQAEDVRFMDEEVKDVHSRLINILWNTFKFYDMYAPTDFREGPIAAPISSNVLDRWIISRLNQLNRGVTENLEEFNTVKAGRPIRDFVQDFSQWYVRRSRDRFKSDDMVDMRSAVGTTRFVLHELSRLGAPFTPYISEEIYRGVGGEKESVHLESWPEAGEVDEGVIESMEEARNTVSLALEARANAGIKVRQPLSQLKVKSLKLKGKREYLELIKNEVNVKEILFDDTITSEVELNTEITEELKREGQARDVIRALQDMRKKAGLTPDDVISVEVETDEIGQKVLEEHREEIASTANIKEFNFKKSVEGESLELDDTLIKMRII